MSLNLNAYTELLKLFMEMNEYKGTNKDLINNVCRFVL